MPCMASPVDDGQGADLVVTKCEEKRYKVWGRAGQQKIKKTIALGDIEGMCIGDYAASESAPCFVPSPQAQSWSITEVGKGKTCGV